MKKLLIVCCAFMLVGLMSSCNRNCNGNWYNNRNVQVEPQENLDHNEVVFISEEADCTSF